MTIEERVAKLEGDKENIYHEINEMKDDIRDLRRLTIAVEKIASKTDMIVNKTDTIANKMDKFDERVSNLENAPGEDFKHYKRTIIGCVITSIISLIIGAIFALIMMKG